MSELVDVLILHGKNAELVNFMKEVFSSLGLKASTVLDLPSKGKNQDQRVEHYIKNCKVALVLATFDGNTKTARPNVHDEIARCRQLKKHDTVVLQERVDTNLVELGSNVQGQLVIIEFEQKKLHRVFPRLLGEIRDRGLLSLNTPAEKKSEAGHILNRFLDDMDKLWDDEFDEAWDNVHRKDYRAERNFAILLDKFFQQYQNVFSALIREKKEGDALTAVCKASYNESHDLAAQSWEIVADAKLQKADQTDGQAERTPKQLDKAATIIKNAKRIPDAIKKIKEFRHAVKLLSHI
jgi:hypothetical protein